VELRTGYLILLLIWMFTGLPILVVGIGIAGPDLFSVDGVLMVLTPPTTSFGGFLSWLISWAIVSAPLWGLIFGLGRARQAPPAPGD